MSGTVADNEKSSSLGRWLKDARENREETLENVSEITRIGKNYLLAIEADRLDMLPSQAYVKGFIRLYTKHLELSAEEAFLRLNSNYSQTVEDSECMNISMTTGSKACKSAVTRRLRKWGIPIFLLLTLSLFIALPTQKHREVRLSGQVDPSPASSLTTTTYPAPAAQPTQAIPDIRTDPVTAAAPVSITQPPSVSGIVLRLKAVQNGRIHITIDTAVSQEYNLEIGDIIEWKAETMFLLELDNAGSVEGELNGVRMKAFGAAGKAAQLRIKADSVR